MTALSRRAFLGTSAAAGAGLVIGFYLPKSATAHDGLGLALSSQGKTDDAIAEYRRAIEISPNYKNAHEHLDAELKDWAP